MLSFQERIFLRIVSHYFIVVILFLGIALLLLAPIHSNQWVPTANNPFGSNDNANHIASIIQAKMALSQGQFPLRTAVLEQSGWGYPLFQFYSPTSYTIAGLIYMWITPANPFLAYKLTIVLAILLGGVYMYRLARLVVHSSAVAVLASVAYLTTPYTICLVSYLGYFNEILALGIIPGVIFYSWRCFSEPEQSRFIFLASLFWYFLITIHLMTFLVLSLLALSFFFILAGVERKYRSLLTVLCAYGFGCSMAVWYLGPIALLQKYLNIKNGFGSVLGPFNAVSPTLSDLFSLSGNFHIPFYRGSMGVLVNAQPAVGLLGMLTLSLSLYFVVKSFFGKREGLPSSFFPLFFVFLGFFFMVWSPINFWAWLPRDFQIIEMTQRLLIHLAWLGALLFAIILHWYFNNKLTVRGVLIGILLIILSTSPWYFGPVVKWTSVVQLVQHPTLDFRKNSYLIFPLHYPELNDIDNMDVDFIFPRQSLRIGQSYSIPIALWSGAVMPKLIISGNMTSTLARQLKSVKVLFDNKLIFVSLLQPGQFKWVVSLPVSGISSDYKAVMSFVSEGHQGSAQPVVPLVEELITGYFGSSTLMSVAAVKPNCSHDGQYTVCDLSVSAAQKWLELPVLYYPNMLDITVNGRAVPYKSMLYGYRLLTAIAPLPNQVNHVRVRFSGFHWANEMSSIAWIVWILGLICALSKKGCVQNKHANSVSS